MEDLNFYAKTLTEEEKRKLEKGIELYKKDIEDALDLLKIYSPTNMPHYDVFGKALIKFIDDTKANIKSVEKGLLISEQK